MAAAGLKTHIWNNNLRSILLLAFYPAILAGLIWVSCWVFFYSFAPGAGAQARFYNDGRQLQVTQTAPRIYSHSDGAVSFANNIVMEYWPTILTAIVFWFITAYFFQTKMVRALAHSRPVTRQDEPELYNLLENLCIARGMKMPRLEVIESPALNAFASGVDDNSYSITVTRGLLQSLQPDEVEAVLGHELTHILNRDVRLLIVSVIFAGMIGFAAQLLWSSIRYHLMFGHRRRDNRGSGQMALVLLVIAGILWVGYMATMFTRFALSRRREFMADAGSVELTKDADAMMRALLRISGRDHIENAPADIALMCIENRQKFFGLFATHPPIEERIKAISAATGTPIPRLPSSENYSNPWQNENAAPKGRRNPWSN